MNHREKFFKRFWTSIAGGFQANKYRELLDQILDDIDRVAELTTRANILEPVRKQRKSRANAEYWLSVRDHARRLFDILDAQWSCSCVCHYPHRANLRLEIRSLSESENPSIKFGFLFSFDSNVAVAAAILPWECQLVEIEPLRSTDME